MRKFIGTITKLIDKKTAKVEVGRIWTHPVYKKRIKRSKNYLIHLEKNSPNLGDKVKFQESRPYSKNKNFKLIEIIKS